MRVPESTDRTAGLRPIVLLDPDARRRNRVASTLRAAGLRVTAFATIAEMQRWPTGALLVVDVSYFTPWWKTIGVWDVIVISPTPDAGGGACERGAGGWVPARWTSEAVRQVVQRASRLPPASDLGMRLATASAAITRSTNPVTTHLWLFWAPFLP